MNLRSLRFRLAASFVGLLLLVMLGFGAYIYERVEAFLIETSRGLLAHRVERIDALVRAIPTTGEPYVAAQIETRYAPELNDKFVRVTRGDGSALFLGGSPNDHSFVPENVPRLADRSASLRARREPVVGASDLLIVSDSVSAGSRAYLVEVGASLRNSDGVLRALLASLAAGIGVVALLSVLGGHVLMERAFGPVGSIMRAAQEITFKHLSRRLPVPESGDEIASLSIALNQMIARLDESFRNTSRFTADASHELRTPLTIIRGELEALMSRRDLAPDLRDELASLLEEIERLGVIVERLLSLSRLDAGEAQSERVRVDLAELSETTAEQMCLLAEEKQISLVCETRDAVVIEGDRARLKQVVVNLLDNAIKYTPSGGRVLLGVRSSGASALLEVSDSGDGVPDAALAHLFERFYRADEVRSREVDGAGLGLAIVHSICSAHAGSVAVENLQPKGCRVTVTLPRAC
jgi:heavy metal sensor kinase